MSAEIHAIPPGLFGPEPTPEEREATERYVKARTQIEQEARQATLRFSAIFCTCPRRFHPAKSPYGKCQIHGQFMMTPDGRVL